MRRVLFMVLVLTGIIAGCGKNAEERHTLTLDLRFDAAEATDCTSYQADKFVVTLYTDDFKTRKTFEFACAADMRKPTLELAAGTYYLTVELLDGVYINSWGSGQVSLISDKTLSVDMNQYAGGIDIEWSSSLCDKLDIAVLSVSAITGGSAVSAIIWGQETTVTDLAIACHAERLSLNNIPSGPYAVTISGRRAEDAPRTRATATITVTLPAGQEKTLTIDDKNLLLEVSDLKVSWEFDSKSITSCTDAGVATIRASATGESDTFSEETACETEGTLTVYDLPPGDYTITADGLDATGKVTYTGHKLRTVEAGKVGNDAYAETIYLKQE
ncbi:MAG TPA: hypothetical protein P5077_09650 [bacterium]|nr:hypothetical protein [bacterium]